MNISRPQPTIVFSLAWIQSFVFHSCCYYVLSALNYKQPIISNKKRGCDENLMRRITKCDVSIKLFLFPKTTKQTFSLGLWIFYSIFWTNWIYLHNITGHKRECSWESKPALYLWSQSQRALGQDQFPTWLFFVESEWCEWYYGE